MAADLAQHFARLKPTSPRPPGHEASHLTAGLAQAGARSWTPPKEENGTRGGDSSGGEAERVSAPRLSRSEASWAAAAADATSDRDTAGTPAIEIPHARGLAGEGGVDGSMDGSMDERGYFDPPADAADDSSKNAGISFDPKVTVDGGRRVPLETPLPKLSIRTRERGLSVLEEMQRHSMQRQLSRARSETDRDAYDAETGERLAEPPQGRRDHRYIQHEPRWPLLQSTVDDLAGSTAHRDHDREAAPARTSPDRTASLTSRTTVSPVLDEAPTPDSTMPAETLSPLAIASPDARADWFAASSADPPRRLASRSKSYGTERRLLRRTSRRSTGASQQSPASAFLSCYVSHSPPVSPDDEGQEVGEYVLGRMIGFGGFSVIREAATIEDGVRVLRAAKIVRRQVAGRGELENEALQAEYEREVEIWRSLAHAHILPLYAVYVTEAATFAITHLNTGGTLFDAVRKNRAGLEPRLARRYAYQVASALRYLHEDMHVVHRDVKLENCLVDISAPDAAATGGSILLCDFGLADYMTDDDGSQAGGGSSTGGSASAPARSPGVRPGADGHTHYIGPSDTSTNFTGSLPYASPEILDGDAELLEPAADVWAFGVSCYAIVTGKLPFQHGFEPRVSMMIRNGEYDRALLQQREAGPSSSAAPAAEEAELEGVTELVGNCLQRPRKQRWTIRDCLTSRWLTPEMAAADERPGWAE